MRGIAKICNLSSYQKEKINCLFISMYVFEYTAKYKTDRSRKRISFMAYFFFILQNKVMKIN